MKDQEQQAMERERAIYEAYLSCQGNMFWQLFIKEISRKEEYLRQRLAKAAVWEEVCRLQGGLNVCQQLLALVEHTGKGSEHGF